jgi:ElaB/YqjD/DUF883 family membrane-anchored ribosome-binding protein
MIFTSNPPAESYKLPSDRIATLAEDTNRLLSEAAAIFYHVGDEAGSEMIEVQSLMKKAMQTLKLAHAKRDALERKNAELHQRLLAKLENNAG